ncbi:hypothetical protein ZWY2020_031005 [Hordeum vulgare]|nr:hypothetical protein ZWY2020_031005 [Hordeum vulgare]
METDAVPGKQTCRTDSWYFSTHVQPLCSFLNSPVLPFFHSRSICSHPVAIAKQLTAQINFHEGKLVGPVLGTMFSCPPYKIDI